MQTRFSEKPVHRHRAAATPSLKSGEGVKVEKSVTVNRPAEELYRFWRQFENFSLFMKHVECVARSGEDSHWVIKTNKGKELEWDARIIEDKPGQMISWQSLEDADVDNAGSVWFIPASGGRGTVVKLSLKYSPPGGKFGAAMSKVLGDDAEKLIAEDMFRFKALMETGEIPTSAGQPVGPK
jgi:uncharacterized membrane protein